MLPSDDLECTRAVQPVATCHQSPYLHKPAIVIVTSFSLSRLAPTALAAPVLIMTSFSLWRHSLLSWPRPPLRTYGHLTAFNIQRCMGHLVTCNYCRNLDSRDEPACQISRSNVILFLSKVNVQMPPPRDDAVLIRLQNPHRYPVNCGRTKNTSLLSILALKIINKT